MVDLSRAAWRKSTRSSTNGCVEVGMVDDQIAVRDSKDREGPVLIFTAHEWEAFLGGAQDGEFELRRLHSRPAPSSVPPLPGAASDPSRSRFPRGARRLAPLLVDYPDLGGP